jgi:adenylate cyclase
MTTVRKLAAILAADVAGYSRLTGQDEEGTLKRIRKLRRELINPAVSLHRGRVVKTTGDGILIEFPSVVDAVRCALDVQRGMTSRNEDVPADQRIEFRVGINIGDVVVEGDDLLGDGVNVAARLEGIAEPGGICISEDAYRQVRDKLGVAFEDAGEQRLKNIARPVRAYRVRPDRGPTQAKPALPLPDKPSIAVLPFQNMSGDPEQDYFADGMVEEIITALSRFRQLFVIARNSTFTYKGHVM